NNNYEQPGVHVAPYPYCFRCPVHQATPDKYHLNNCCNDPIDQVELLLKQQTAPKDTAAILIETVLGEGGYVPPPKNFFPRLKEICNKNDILLIVDEVQSGFGRTGKMFAIEHYGVEPDVIVMAKGIATIATLEIFEEEKLLDNVNARSSQLFSLLDKKLKPILPQEVGVNIRGLGLMIGIEFTGVPYGFAASVAKESLEQNLIILTASIYETLRLIPPLNITEEEIDDGVERLCKALSAVVERLVKEGKL
ncbi:976_t:CDS:2, partial [Acaulospora colombiana]